MSTSFSTGAGLRSRRSNVETKPFFLTSEFVFYILSVIGVLVASAVVDVTDGDELSGFDAQSAWTMITVLTFGYMLSRGIAKSGSRTYQDDRADVPTAPTHLPSPPSSPPPNV